MPTSYFAFAPVRAGPPFQFQPTLDDQDYLANVVWNVFGQRWYISLWTGNSVPVFTQALVGSPQLIDVQTIRWQNGFAIMEAVFPRTFRIGDSFNMTVSDFLPVAYNTSNVLGLVISETEIMYPLAQPPDEQPLKLGRVTYDINLAGGYFLQSHLVFRFGSQQFEVWSP